MFDQHKLIYTKDGRWVSREECRWQSHFPSLRLALLGDIYPSCSLLLRQVLDIARTNLNDLIEELKGVFADATDMARIQDDTTRTRLLHYLDKSLREEKASDDQVETLRGLSILPVSHIDIETASSRIQWTRAAQQDFWVADIPRLKDLFEGKIPLLDLSGARHALPAMEHLQKTLGLLDQRLTVCVKIEEARTVDGALADHTLAQALGRILVERWPYIAA